MEIIHLILGKANPDRMNGVNKAVHHLASSQVALGHLVEVWGITPTPEKDAGMRPYRVRLFRALRNKLRIDKDLIEAIRAAPSGAVFHLHGGFITEFFHAARHLSDSGHEFIFTSHGSYNTVALRKSGWIKKLYFPLIEKSVLSRAKTLHFLGRSEYDAVERLFPNSKKVLVPNGQDIPWHVVQSPEKRLKNGPVFGFCGRLTSYTKGLDLMLEAFRKYVFEANLPGDLWIIGDGDDRAELEKTAAAYGISSRVKFHGSQFGDRKMELLSEIDVFLHPSRNEGMPMAVLEACALSVPVLVSRETNVGEHVEMYNAGWVMKENTADEQFAVMCRVFDEFRKTSFEQYRNNALRMIREEFAWEKVADKLVQVYAA